MYLQKKNGFALWRTVLFVYAKPAHNIIDLLIKADSGKVYAKTVYEQYRIKSSFLMQKVIEKL